MKNFRRKMKVKLKRRQDFQEKKNPNFKRLAGNYLSLSERAYAQS